VCLFGHSLWHFTPAGVIRFLAFTFGEKNPKPGTGRARYAGHPIVPLKGTPFGPYCSFFFGWVLRAGLLGANSTKNLWGCDF